MSLEHPAVLFRKGTALAGGVPRTLIVLGPARGGTTMAAQMLHDLGIFMGQDLNSTYQDAVMSQISRALFHGQIDVDHPVIEQALRRRDQEFDVWGWKFPTHVFERLYAKARNPHMIVIFRDPVAIATRDSVSNGYNFEACFERALEQISNFAKFVLSTSSPCLVLSYERSLTNKSELVDALLYFAGTTASQEARNLAVQRARPGSIRYLAETRAGDIEGRIDGVDVHIARWLRYPHQADRRVSFTVAIDGVPIYEGAADRFRKDLKKAFNNDGCCSFEIPTPTYLRDGKQHKVSIKILDVGNFTIENNENFWTIAMD